MLKSFLAILALQICLDRRGFSPNAMDGQDGYKTRTALAAYCAANGLPPPRPGEAETAYVKYFPYDGKLFTVHTVTQADLDAIVKIPTDPAEKAKLSHMGYESIKEMFAERGHITQNTLGRLNPKVCWTNVTVGTAIKIPEVTPAAVGELASLVRVSLSKFTVTAVGSNGKPLAVFPCSIARDKAKRPKAGEIKITTYIENPNYTYTPDHVPKGAKAVRHIFPPGPNNPVGTVWMGLSLPGYGMHGTPSPGTIGRAESHGCFRLANWNAEKLFELVRSGTRVVIEE